MPLPDFRNDGYLTTGVHLATEADVLDRFGKGSIRRTMLMARLSNWLAQTRAVKATRFLLDGSFVTAKTDPNDVDCAVWIPRDFDLQRLWGKIEADQLYLAAASGRPAEIYLVETQVQWDDWIRFFGRTRETDARRKGIVEVVL